MKKKRILFDISGHDTWIGGVYYMRNIIYQIYCSEELKSICTPVIVCSDKFKLLFDRFTEIGELYVYEENNRKKRLFILLKITKEADLIYYYHQYKFDPLNLLSNKAIFWIPDFQEYYYPDFFTENQLRDRIERGNKISSKANPLVLSSKSCYDDYVNFFSNRKFGNRNVFIIPFVSAIDNEIKYLNDETCEKTLMKFDLHNKLFVLISNQFWQHKNHIVVFEMISKAKQAGRLEDILFVFTGKLKDYRNKNYYERLVQIIQANNIDKNIKILGFIDRKEQLILMHRAAMIIQPSLFEGWGTVVEDGKVLDKTIILSDIPVHREQMNDKCCLFTANDSDNLLETVEKALQNLKSDDIEKGINEMRQNAIKYSSNLKKLLLYNGE